MVRVLVQWKTHCFKIYTDLECKSNKHNFLWTTKGIGEKVQVYSPMQRLSVPELSHYSHREDNCLGLKQ